MALRASASPSRPPARFTHCSPGKRWAKPRPDFGQRPSRSAPGRDHGPMGNVVPAAAGTFGSRRGRRSTTEANARLTSITGMVLFVLLAVQGVTIVAIHRLVTAHIVLGLVLLGPLAVKLGSTGYRFMRYYAGDPDYSAAGPPQILLRLLAPFVVLTTLVVFGSGIALIAVKPRDGGLLLFLHKVSFILWFGAMTIHVLAYLLPAATRTLDDLTGRGPAAVLASRRSRWMILGGGTLLGLVLGIAGLGWAHPWSVWFGAGGARDR